MQCLHGDFARHYNRRNAFLGERYHATMIESGNHLQRCIQYIDLNMVRPGVVEHPADWGWTGYQKLMGTTNETGKSARRCKNFLMGGPGIPGHGLWVSLQGKKYKSLGL